VARWSERPQSCPAPPTAWTQADLPGYFWNSAVITVPALILTLLPASMVAFVVSRHRSRINLALLAVRRW